MIEAKEFFNIQGYWNSKGENEIDIVAINDTNKRLVLCEVKRNPKCIIMNTLKNKAKEIVAEYPKLSVEYKGLSLDDM